MKLSQISGTMRRRGERPHRLEIGWAANAPSRTRRRCRRDARRSLMIKRADRVAARCIAAMGVAL
jgi:hypothetical protein